MGAIYRRELKSLFCGMVAPVFIAFVLLMTGVVSSNVNFSGTYPQFEYVVPTVAYIFLLVVPILTMRSFSEEKANKTDQLLYSLPVSTFSVVAGKFLAMVTVLLTACAGMCIYPPILSIYGDVYMPSSYLAIFAFFLMGCAFIAIGMFISTLSESQVISAVVTIGLFLILYLIENVSSQIPTTALASFLLFIALCAIAAVVIYLLTKSSVIAAAVGAVLIIGVSVVYFVNSSLFEGAFANMLNSLNLFTKMYNFMYGIFDLKVIVYYLSVIGLFGFLTVQSFDKKRWN